MRNIYFSVILGTLALTACSGDSSSNRAPRLMTVQDVTISANETAQGITITVMDRNRNIAFTTVSSEQGVIPNSGLVLVADGRDAVLSITPAPNVLGIATITLTATDPGGLSDQVSFSVTVEQQQQVSLRQFVVDAFNDDENDVPRDINSRQFADDIGEGDLANLIN